ncbi:unnamed protein product [Closterium sp. NIES-64]|nr:unnamed protein product [Closterium sp. NIES-64]
MTLLTVSDADRRRRKAELAEFKADIAIIRERFQNIKQEDMQLSFQLHHMHEQEDREHAGLISGRGIRAYEPPTIRKMYDSVTQPTPSTTPSSPELHGSKAPAPTSPSNAENQQPASSVTSASSGAASSAGAFSLIQDLLSGQRLFSEVLPWSRSNPPADAANSGDALLKQAGLDGFTLLSPNAQSQNQSPAVAQSPQKESTASQASSVGLLPLGNEGSGSEIVSSPQRSSALSPPAASADTTGGSPPSVPRLSRVHRPTHRASAVSVSSPASSTSALRTPSSAQAARPPSPSRVVSLSENSPSCVGQGVSPSSSATPSIGAQQTPLRALTPAQQLRAELAERRSGVAAKLFSDAAKEALLVRAGLLPGPADAGAIRARSSEEGAGAGVGDSAGAIRATLAERVAQSASAGSAGATPGKIEEGWQSESVAESLRLSGELRSRLRAALGERECAKSGRGGGGGGQLCGRLLLLLVVAQGLYILKLKFSPRSDAQRQSAATAAQSQSNGHDLTKLFSASGAVNAQRDVDADSIHLGGPRTYEASRGAAGYGSHERKWVRKFAGGGIDANDDSEPGEETRKGVEFRSGDDDWMVDGTKTTRPLRVDEESAGRGGSGGEEAERKGVEFRSGDDDWMVDGTQTTRPLIVDEERGGTGGGGGEEAERKGMELRSGDDDWMVDGTQSGQEVIVDEDTWRGGRGEGGAAGEGEEEGEGDGEPVWQSPLDEPSEWSPLQGAPDGLTCRSWLQEADDVAFGRDFEKQPITVMAYEVRPSPTTHGKQLITVMAYENDVPHPCDVPCKLVRNYFPALFPLVPPSLPPSSPLCPFSSSPPLPSIPLSPLPPNLSPSIAPSHLLPIPFYSPFPSPPTQNQIRKYPCDVPCELVGKRRPSQLDASLAGGVPRHKAVLRSMEPRGYYKSNDPAWAHRDHAVVMTVHYDSDVPVQYGSWEEYHVMRPPVNKTASALAAAFISNCHANNFRLEAVKELSWHMEVPSYDRCLNNMPHEPDKLPVLACYHFFVEREFLRLKELSRHMEVHSYGRCLNNMPYKTDKLPVLAQHLFSFAFENTCEGDYVTEKYWQCLVAGSIPVVIGAPNIANFAPSPNSYLEIKSLEDVPRVAQQMVTLAGNQTAYDEMLAWKKDGPSQAFIANMDLSAVHSSCRLCIFLADRIRRKDLDAAKTRRPCRCEAPGKREGEKLVVYHLYVRERGTFHFTSVFLRSDHLTLRGLTLAIRRSFQKKTHRPVWVGKRPASLGGDEKAWALKIYRIYPAGSTQREALWGEAWFRNLSQVVAHVTAHPCARLEVIFV